MRALCNSVRLDWQRDTMWYHKMWSAAIPSSAMPWTRSTMDATAVKFDATADDKVWLCAHVHQRLLAHSRSSCELAGTDSAKTLWADFSFIVVYHMDITDAVGGALLQPPNRHQFLYENFRQAMEIILKVQCIIFIHIPYICRCFFRIYKVITDKQLFKS